MRQNYYSSRYNRSLNESRYGSRYGRLNEGFEKHPAIINLSNELGTQGAQAVKALSLLLKALNRLTNADDQELAVETFLTVFNQMGKGSAVRNVRQDVKRGTVGEEIPMEMPEEQPTGMGESRYRYGNRLSESRRNNSYRRRYW